MKKQHKYYVSALVTCNGSSSLVEFIDDELAFIVGLRLDLVMGRQPKINGLGLLPTNAEVSNVSHVVEVRDWK